MGERLVEERERVWGGEGRAEEKRGGRVRPATSSRRQASTAAAGSFSRPPLLSTVSWRHSGDSRAPLSGDRREV